MKGRIKYWEAQALMTACHPVGHAEQSARKEVTKVVEVLDTGFAHVMIDGLDPPCSLLYGDVETSAAIFCCPRLDCIGG